MYDIITRVPTIVWSPGRFEGGRRVEELCQLFDLGPTVLELAGVEPDETMAAESLVPALDGDEDWEGREAVYAEHSRDGTLRGTDFMTMVRTEDWKLVHFVDHEEGQLFDLTADPEEENNLWNDPDVQNKKQDLLTRMLEWRIETGLQSGDWAAEFR